jgi:cell division protein ZapD
VFTECNTTVEKSVTFEHPMNEEMRVFLCLEKLFHQLQHSISLQQTKPAIIAILKIINVLDRPDIKIKICQRLNLYATSLSQLKQFDNVDTHKLTDILQQIDVLKAQMHQQTTRLGEKLKHIEFLNQLRQNINLPGSLAYHNCFIFQAWSHQPLDHQIHNIHTWKKELDAIEKAVNLILKLTRQTAVAQKHIAINGQFQKTLNSNLALGLIVVTTQCSTYPEFSASKRHFNIRFMQPNFNDHSHPTQLQQDVPFTLHYCQI